MNGDRDGEGIVRAASLGLLEIKDSDIRILNLEQARDASDKGIHAGGAMSAVIPLVALYYGGGMRFDVADPTRPGQDLFVLSKGHAVAAMASVYADLGYFPASVLKHLPFTGEPAQGPSRTAAARRPRVDRAARPGPLGGRRVRAGGQGAARSTTSTACWATGSCRRACRGKR